MSEEQSNSKDSGSVEKVGIPIDADRFRILVTEYLQRMDANEDMDVKDYITLTRIWNTILFNSLGQKDELFNCYSTVYYPKYMERISRSLGALPTKGMALYSKEYDLFIGGKPHFHSMYKLEEMQ
jgi:hypothetical protein